MDADNQRRNLTDLLAKTGAVIPGHYLYKSGRHSEVYVDKDKMLAQVQVINRMCYRIARHFFVEKPQVVAGPSMGGAIMAQWVAHYLEPIALAIYAEDVDGAKAFRRGFADFIPGRSVLIVDDVVDTGTSAHQVIAAVEDLGGRVLGIGALWNPGEISFGVYPFFDLIDDLYETYLPSECPLCQQGLPLVDAASLRDGSPRPASA